MKLIIPAALLTLLALACFAATADLDPATRTAWVWAALLALSGLIWTLLISLRRSLREAEARIEARLREMAEEREARWAQERQRARERVKADLDFYIHNFAPREKETDPNAKTLP